MTNAQVLEKMSEQFMQPQVTRKLYWVELDGTHGSTYLPLADVGKPESFSPDRDEDEQEIEFYAKYYEGTIQTINYISGYGARLSAPGYMDATEYCVFDSPEEAEAYLVEMYGDDITDDDESEYAA